MPFDRAAWTRAKRATDPWFRARENHHLTPCQITTLRIKFGDVCWICQRPESNVIKGRRCVLCIDHDHACCPGKFSCGSCVRGLLCSLCNSGIGKLRDSASLLRRAADYLDQHHGAV